MLRTSLPRFLTAGVGIALALALLTGCLSSGQTSVAAELNADRTANRLKALPTHPALNAKAQAWAEKLAKGNKLSHSRLVDGAPDCWRSLGENVGYGGSIAKVEDAYMQSVKHRANVLSPKWDFVGVGTATRDNRVFTVQVFMAGCT